MYILKSKFWVEEKKVSSMSERITNFLMKILIFPIILFFIYGVAWIIGMRIAVYIYKVEDIFFFRFNDGNNIYIMFNTNRNKSFYYL